MGKKRKLRMAQKQLSELAPEDYETNWESDGTGGEVEVTRYADGSSTYHFGGPCGPMSFDENGEEC